ncbi:MAG: ABC-type branched-chain amino acid transport system, ATPase component, partial [Acidimicrobiales bacterium]|nr:ABC-type branched-chain amino acid transport system, ATPase component [Acidimicrobiales bacterium]
MLALLGTNGAGKSTVLRVVAGLMRPGRGRVTFAGEDITDLDPVERVKRGLVTVPGGRGVFGSLTVAENLRLAGWLARKDHEFLEAARAKVFELFPALERRLTTKASNLSGGEQQMLTLAQALLCRPRVLLIDELSLGLAPTVVGTLIDVVRKINEEGTSVVVVEQSVNVATGIATRATFMEKGQVRFSGPTADLVDRPDLLRSVFLSQASPATTKKAKAGDGHRGAPKPELNGDARLEVRGIGRRFAGVVAVDDVDLTVGAGQILGIIGSNGAGKTTLFDLCSGFLAADAGRVMLDGLDVTGLGASGRAERGLGRSFQDARLFPSMTVTETLATAL